MDGGAWWAAVHGVTKSRTQLSDFSFTFHFHALEKEMATPQCSCLENPRDGWAWWAAVYGVAQSRTRLKRLSSSSSSSSIPIHLTVCRYIYLKTFTDINTQKCVYRYVHTQLHTCVQIYLFFPEYFSISFRYRALLSLVHQHVYTKNELDTLLYNHFLIIKVNSCN